MQLDTSKITKLYVFDNYIIVDQLIKAGHPLRHIRPDFKNRNRRVYEFDVEAYEDYKRIVENFKNGAYNNWENENN